MEMLQARRDWQKNIPRNENQKPAIMAGVLYVK